MSDTSRKKIAKGDTLIWVSSLENMVSRKEVTVDKVGRKWLTIANSWRGWKVDISTLKVAGDRGHGRCFRSEADMLHAVNEHNQKRAADKAWEKLRKKTHEGWRRPEHLTEEAILQAMATLGWSES